MNLSSNRIFYFSALLFAFSFSLSRAAVSFFIIWFVVLFIIRNDYRTAWNQIKKSRVLQIIGIFITLLTLSILWSEDKTDALNQIRLYSYWIIIPILAVTLKREWLPNIITAFLAGMLISEIFAYGIYFEFWTINGRPSDYPSPFMSHIHFSIFLATTAAILFFRLLSNEYSWQKKLLIFIFFIATTGNLMLSTGRTGQLAFFITLGIALIIRYRLTFRSLVLFAVLNLALVLGTYWFIEPFKIRIDRGIEDFKELQSGNFNTSLGARAVFWIATNDILHKHPLLGVGLGDYKHAAAEVLKENDHGIKQGVIAWCTDTHFHNQYLMILVQTGLVGFALMLWLFIELFRLKIDNAQLKGFSILGLSVFIVGCIAEPLWILQFPIILFIFIVSISLAASMNTTIPTKEA